jgi:hypothetical protein
MDKQIRDRISRPTDTKGVIPGSTPVISFGDFTKASVVSLSINPSSKEFLKGKGLLPPNEKRLGTDVVGTLIPTEIHTPGLMIWNQF